LSASIKAQFAFVVPEPAFSYYYNAGALLLKVKG